MTFILCYFKNGAENRIRTDDPRITNALLYQLSYPGDNWFKLLITVFVATFDFNIQKLLRIELLDLNQFPLNEKW